ncbi:MAG TPA: phosphotransferase, partial [Ktedonobacterales bacterium]
YARDRSDVAALLAWLGATGFGAASALRVPAPLAYLPRRRLLLLEHVPGEPARAALRRGELAAAERAALWLARLRTLAPAPPPAARPRDPLAQARRWAALVARDAPALAPAARALAAALAAAPLETTEPRLLHGDFGPSHVLLAPGATSVIDWDAWRTGDPAEDAGRFIASLRHMALREPDKAPTLAAAAAAFTDTYRALAGESAARLRWYTAWGCLRRARRLALRARPGYSERAAAMLAAGLATLRER